MTTPPITSRIELIRAHFPKAGRGVEVGVLRGDFSARLLAETKPWALWLVDPWAWTDPEHGQVWGWDDPARRGPSGEETYLSVLRRFWDMPRVIPLRTVSVYAAGLFADGSLDWVYIDGNHRYEACLGDLRSWTPKIGANGILAGHDYNELGVQWAVRDFLKEHPDRYQLHVTQEKFPSFWFRT